MDRKTKLYLICGGGFLLLLVMIMLFVASCSQKDDEVVMPTPTFEVELSPMPEPTPIPTPEVTTTPSTVTPPEATIPTEPTATPMPEPTIIPEPVEPNPPTSTSTSTSTATTTPKPITAPAFDFGLPSAVNVGTQIAVQTSQKNVTGVSWMVTKNGTSTGDINGRLTVDGGTISFDKPGKYTLTAIATNAEGKEVSVASSVEVFEVGKFAFALPAFAYTDTVVDVDVLEGADTGITWSVEKDGASMANTTAFSGNLNDSGGMITFRTEGKYTLTGKSKSGQTHTASITVYPLLRFPFTLPATTYRDTDFAVTMGEQYLNGETLSWELTKGVVMIEVPTGTLTNGGGTLSLPDLGAYTLTASATDMRTGRLFTQSRSITVVNQSPTITQSTAAIGNTRDGNKVLVEFAATAADPDGDETTLQWDGRNANDMYSAGTHEVRVRATDAHGAVSAWKTISFEVPNTPPEIVSTSAVEVRSNIKNAAVFVELGATGTDADGDEVFIEWDGRTQGDYYGLGDHTVKVRARDSFGSYSDWTDVTFTISNTAPERPAIIRTPSESIIFPGTNVTVNAAAIDADGDPLTYVWDGRPSEIYAYPEGRVIVSVKAVDPFGAESPTKKVMWIMGDPNRAGSLMLTGPDSSISEPGIEDATLIYYKFVVPPVDGHSGQDYGRVRGYNRLTGQWDQLDYGTTSNGISFERNLEAGVYTKLDLYYYTNHQCMYNLSNITYIALFEFDELEDE